MGNYIPFFTGYEYFQAANDLEVRIACKILTKYAEKQKKSYALPDTIKAMSDGLSPRNATSIAYFFYSVRSTDCLSYNEMIYTRNVQISLSDILQRARYYNIYVSI